MISPVGYEVSQAFKHLSETTPELIIEAMQAAKKSGAVVSFDLNYRPELWPHIGGLDQARKVFRRITQQGDVLLGNEEDLLAGLGIKGPDVQSISNLDTKVFFQMIGQVTSEFPYVKMVATTLREVQSSNRYQWGSVVWGAGEQAVSFICELNVIDRIGGGDGFATGLIYGLITGRKLDEALRLGQAHGALVTTFPGDTTMAKLPEVEAFAKG